MDGNLFAVLSLTLNSRIAVMYLFPSTLFDMTTNQYGGTNFKHSYSPPSDKETKDIYIPC